MTALLIAAAAALTLLWGERFAVLALLVIGTASLFALGVA